MKQKLKIVILLALIIAVAVGICFLVVNAIRSIPYNNNAQNPVVTLEIEGYGQVQIELYPDYAPNTVTHIINLVQNGFYDGKLFYGTDGVAVSAGMGFIEEEEEEATDEESTEETDEETTEETSEEVTEDTSEETTDETEEEEETTPEEDTLMASFYDSSIEADSDSDYEIAIEGEFVANGYDDNTLRFEYGTVGMYRNDYEGYGYSDLSSYSYNSGTSLFFILTEEDSTLNGMYTAFGKVISGMDIIEQINELETQEDEDTTDGEIVYFVDYPVITSATVETYGIDYGTPKYVEAFDYSSWLNNLLLQYYSSSY